MQIINLKFFKKYILQSIIPIFILNSVLIFSYYIIHDLYSKINYNIVKKIATCSKDMPNSSQLICDVIGCNYIINNNTVITHKDYTYLNNATYSTHKNYETYGMILDLKEEKIIVNVDLDKVFPVVVKTFILINLMVFLIHFVFFARNEIQNRRKQVMYLLSTESSIQEKNMRLLTENIHHELNTPIAIISGLSKRLKRKLDDLYKTDGACGLNDYSDLLYGDKNEFEQIDACIEQVNSVLLRMSNFKHLRYSNGNKTIFDIANYSANSMSVLKKYNFKIYIDEDLKLYSLKGTLKNGDLLGILSNHFRNSIEAMSTVINLSCRFENDKLKLFITDNGVGIRDYRTGLLLTKDKLDIVFQPYYSTKDIDGNLTVQNIGFIGYSKKLINDIIGFFKIEEDLKKEYRGFGLYYIKELLNDHRGDVRLRETSEKGTVFELTVQAKRKE